MITRLEVDGFKSLRGFAIDLEPFTVLIGPNGAGKSNVLEAIGLLSRLAPSHISPEDALKGGRGRASDQFSRYRSESVREIVAALEMLQPDTYGDEAGEYAGDYASRHRYEIQLTKRPASGGIEHVRAEWRSRFLANLDDRWLHAHPEWAQLATIQWTATDLQWTENRPHLNLVEFAGIYPRESSERIDSGKLAADGHNLPSVLASLADDEVGEIRAELSAMVPGVANFEIVESDDAYRLEFHMRDGDVVPARLISSGTLRVLALLTAIYSQQNNWSSVLCIEEPENGIYPGRLRRLIELLREVTDSRRYRERESTYPPPQVIVTTHSPLFLAALAERPEHLRYIDTVQRGKYRVTRARQVGEKEDRDTIAPATIAAVLEDATRREDDR